MSFQPGQIVRVIATGERVKLRSASRSHLPFAWWAELTDDEGRFPDALGADLTVVYEDEIAPACTSCEGLGAAGGNLCPDCDGKGSKT